VDIAVPLRSEARKALSPFRLEDFALLSLPQSTISLELCLFLGVFSRHRGLHSAVIDVHFRTRSYATPP